MCDEKPFDELVELFKEDPDAFEEYRKEFVEQRITELCIDCPEKLELCKRFQWRLEQELAKYKDPMARYNAMVSMFWDQVELFKAANKKLKEIHEAQANAKILSFPKK